MRTLGPRLLIGEKHKQGLPNGGSAFCLWILFHHTNSLFVTLREYFVLLEFSCQLPDRQRIGTHFFIETLCVKKIAHKKVGMK